MRKQKHRSTKATPDEAAYELPREVDFSKLTPVGFGVKALDIFERSHRHTVELAPDVARVFKNSQAVNEVLRAIIAHVPSKKRKTA